MANIQERKKDRKYIVDAKAPDGPGQITQPNPGEQPPDWAEKGMPRNSLGAFPAQGNRAGGGVIIDDGARVGYLRNLEFSAGGRSQLLATATASTQRPHISPITDQVQVSSATEAGVSAGTMDQAPAQAGAQPHAGHPPAQPEMTMTGDENLDTSAGPGPERRVDRRGV
jgi:hypothetical protein